MEGRMSYTGMGFKRAKFQNIFIRKLSIGKRLKDFKYIVMPKPIKIGKLIPDNDSTTTYRNIIKNYLLTDLSLKQCVEFNLLDTPQIINIYPQSKKKTGFLFSLNNNEMFPQNEMFSSIRK